jgi:hypothetical protein
MKYEIIKIDSASVFRLVFFVSLIVNGILGIVFIIISPFIGKFFIALIFFVIGAPLISLIKAFIFWIMVNIYNIFAKKFGGIEIELDKNL